MTTAETSGEASSPNAPVGHRLGSRFLYQHTPPLAGEDVARLQECLRELAYEIGDDKPGVFGSGMAAALNKLQRDKEISIVTGIFGPKTYALFQGLGLVDADLAFETPGPA